MQHKLLLCDVRSRNVCALAPVFARRRVACEELEMSVRGIRHLKREEVNATQLGIKNQATSASEQSDADENISAELLQDPRCIYICFCLPAGSTVSRSRCTSARRISLAHFKLDVIQEPN